MAIKGIIFDYGGTLDTPGIHWKDVLKEAWRNAGVAANDALFLEAYIYAEQELSRTTKILPHNDFSDLMLVKVKLQLEYLAENGHFPPAQIDAKSQEIADYCYNYAKENTSKASEILEKLSQKYPLAIVSNFYGNLKAVLKDFNLDKYFKVVVDSEEVKIRKPDSAIFSIAIKELGLNPEEVLVVGDNQLNDIEPAKELGCQTVNRTSLSSLSELLKI